MKRFLFDCGTRDSVASTGLFVLRLGISSMMLLGHGLPKLKTFGETKSIVGQLVPLPWINPTVTTSACLAAEILAPILLMLGLLTRPAAFMLGFAMVVAAFHVHQTDPWFLGPGVPAAKELALLYLLPMMILILSGPGGFSADAVIYQEKRRKRW
jgi:putative oxidoreductase